MSHGIRRNKYGNGEDQESEFKPPNTFLIEMDGALVDSIPILYKAYEDLLRKFKCIGSKSEFKKLVGLNAPEFLLALSDIHGLKGSLKVLEDQYRTLLAPHYNEKMVLFPGALEFLDEASQSGFSIVLVSAMDPTLVYDFLRIKKIQNKFDLVVTGEEFRIQSQSYLNEYHYAFMTLGVDPEEVVSVVHTMMGKECSLDTDLVTLVLTHMSEGKAMEPTGDSHCIQVRDWKALQPFLNP